MARRHGKTERSAFGKLLQEYRLRSRDPVDNGRLTQERLGELLGEVAGLPAYTYVDVSRWEKGGKKGRVIPHEDRLLLLGLIQVLHQCGGIRSKEEANDLLKAGGYSDLDGSEIDSVNSSWLVEAITQLSPIYDSGQLASSQTSAIEAATVPDTSRRRLPDLPAPFMVPPLPPQGVLGREGLLSKIVELLYLADQQRRNAPPLSLLGMGGVGKTTLTLALGRLEGMRQQFPDGILWTALGPSPTVRFLQEDWGRALGVDLKPEQDENSCRRRLQEILYDRQVLLIVDDVWEIQHGQQFEVAGPACRLLFTTRELDVANHLSTQNHTIQVDILSPEASLLLLERMVPQAVLHHKKAARQLCERLEYLPLALTLAGRFLANEVGVPTRLQRLVDELIERREARLHLLQAEGRLGLDEKNPVSLQAILGLSVDRLSPVDRERFAMASVFGGEPLSWQLDMAAHVWECCFTEAEETVARFIRRGLVYAQGNGRYWMHALLADYAQELMEQMGL